VRFEKAASFDQVGRLDAPNRVLRTPLGILAVCSSGQADSVDILGVHRTLSLIPFGPGQPSATEECVTSPADAFLEPPQRVPLDYFAAMSARSIVVADLTGTVRLGATLGGIRHSASLQVPRAEAQPATHSRWHLLKAISPGARSTRWSDDSFPDPVMARPQ
jgi:hypothetical protein